MEESAGESPHAELGQVLARCCQELVESLSAGSAPTDGTSEGQPVVSFIELSGGDIDATLVARIDGALLRSTHPRRHHRLTEEDCAGWASEIVNQIAGRFVNQLGRRGVNGRIGIPGSLLAPSASLHLGAGTLEVFAGGGLSLYLALDELRRPLKGVALDDATRQEGELVFF